MQSAKKALLAVTVLVAFAAYSWHARHEAQTVAIITPRGAAKTAAATTSGTSTAASNTTSSSAGSVPAVPAAAYKDGTYTGSVADAFYGNIQVQVVVSGGKLTDVVFLQHPGDRRESIMINDQAMPLLKQEALQAQSAQVDGVSGATDTSQAFVQSLTVALSQAKA